MAVEKLLITYSCCFDLAHVFLLSSLSYPGPASLFWGVWVREMQTTIRMNPFELQRRGDSATKMNEFGCSVVRSLLATFQKV